MSKKIWRYLELDKIAHLPNQGRELLGKYIYFTEKRDGSCLAIWLKKKSKHKQLINRILRKRPIVVLHPDYYFMISSRNMMSAQKSIQNDFKMSDDCIKTKQYLLDNPTHVIFGELLRRGLSPTRIENHEHVEFIVFDIFNGEKFFSYQQVHQFCYHYGMKCVQLFGEGQFTSMESLLNYRDEMLKLCESEKREGVVLKTFREDNKPLYAKEKLDTATPRGHPKMEKGKPEYPPLPLSEAMGAVDKAYADLGESFADKKQAMPMVAKYIQEEMKKHLCSSPEANFYNLYRQYCNDHEIKLSETSVKLNTKSTLMQKIRKVLRI